MGTTSTKLGRSLLKNKLMTRLYDIEKEEFISKVFDPYYTVNGERPVLPENIVELEIITPQRPQIDQNTHKLVKDIQFDFEGKTYTEQWLSVELSAYEIAMRDWEGGDLPIRIIADADMATTEFGIAMFTHFNVRQLPIIPKGEKVHLYCHEIQPQFKGAVDFYISEGKVTIENKPTPE